ncbi:PRC-barrel domain-containing protein [Paraburkholderia hospita]|uniref:PRC-barrel domain-containing protein n=1 Tax=Paraburkholderia hospita TaxID=169430 RepID=UPI001375221D|nr:PRC-barrel domain-containing protein [Paraburkholderia hospita]
MSSLNQGKRSRNDESCGGIVRAIGGQASDVMSTSRFAGVTVISVDGHDVGRVVEIMADLRDGRIAYVVLADGEFLAQDSR